ncbi:MAG: site-2 protease family protein [Ruminococcaceae bacterium]|nr:site-2 protease family protein [Oscillospiraceae bacterium]
MDTILYLLLTLVLLSIMVVIHELGHFLFAKLFKVTVLEFSIGMGPAIFTTKKKSKKDEKDEIAKSFHSSDNEDVSLNTEALDGETATENAKTVFSVRALPIGGYVSMAGEDDASTDVNAFCNKSVWQRFLITIAGPIMNILLGILCMFSLVGIESAQNGYLASNTIAGFQENALSDKCESPLMVGDTVIKVDGVRIHTGNELVYEIMNSGYEPIDIVVIRNGERITLENVVFPTDTSAGATFGSYDFTIYGEDANFGSIMKHSIYRSFSTIKIITDSLKDLLTGRYGAEAVSGPVGMAGAVGQATKNGVSSLLYLFTLITMNLGVFNLLPVPALDGGRIVFLLIEAITRKPVKKEVEQMVNTVGILILFALMIFITFKDIFTLFT